MPHNLRPDATEPLTLAEAFGFTLRHLPVLGPLVFALAGSFWGMLWLLTGAGAGHDLLRLEAPHVVALADIAPVLLQCFLLGAGLLVGFVVLGVALRQLSRSDHLSLSRLARALEAELLPMLRCALHAVHRRPYLFALGLLPLIATGMTPVGGIGLLFDLIREPSPGMQFATVLIALLSLAILYYLMPYLFTMYHALFHELSPAEAEAAVWQGLGTHRTRMFGGLLIAALPYYVADECLFYIDWHPVLRHALGAVFGLPFATTAYLFYARIERSMRHAHPA